MNQRARNQLHGAAVLLLLLIVLASPAAANQPPRAVAAANVLPDGTMEASVRLLVGPTPGDTIAWTVRGGGSSDPDGDPLTYQWQCDDGNGNKCFLQSNVTNVTDLRVLFPAGTCYYTLIVKDPSGASSTDTAQVKVLVDNIPPEVLPPDDATVSATETGVVLPANLDSQGLRV